MTTFTQYHRWAKSFGFARFRIKGVRISEDSLYAIFLQRKNFKRISSVKNQAIIVNRLSEAESEFCCFLGSFLQVMLIAYVCISFNVK